MSTINTNIPAVTAQRHLMRSQRALGISLERLSSGLRINRGADDPAGLIVSERLRAEIEAVNQSIDNTSRAINVIATTEGALDEVAALLIELKLQHALLRRIFEQLGEAPVTIDGFIEARIDAAHSLLHQRTPQRIVLG